MARLFYFFANGRAEGRGDMKDVLGGKGAGLAEMTNVGLPVPPGFTISTRACAVYFKGKGKMPGPFEAEQKRYIARLEKAVGAKFNDAVNPLLVSVRSGARDSMPGMMDTILNIGLNDKTVEALARRTGDPRFSYDCYRRLVMMFGDVVFDVPKKLCEEILHARKHERGLKEDLELNADDMRYLARRFLDLFREKTGKTFPQDPVEQVRLARDAVFRSWHNPRAVTYRRLYHIPDHLGTAVNVQAMVFGNMGATSGTGVGFTRNPGTGEKKLYGEFLQNAQGEDVVAGVRTPIPILKMRELNPAVFDQLEATARRLEKHYRDVQDFEFTIQDGKLYMLQTRSGKRNGVAAIRIANDLVREKLIDKKRALRLVRPEHMEQALHPMFDPDAMRDFEVVAKGLAASPGAASGRAVFTPERAVEFSERGERVILVRAETCPDDIAGMVASKGFLTATGGMTSHAAVVGRGLGKPAVVGCSEIVVDEEKRQFRDKRGVINEGDYISIDGYTGQVIAGDVPLRDSEILQAMRGKIDPKTSEIYRDFFNVLEWADDYRRLRVRANGDTPADAEIAFKFGAEGIGLCRTEHMFFAKERIPVVQEMILARTKEERQKALDKLLPMQRGDFVGIFKAMGGKPVTIRTIDPPLHEFLPQADVLIAEIEEAERHGRKDEARNKRLVLKRVEELHEINPMLGHRGCRLGITMPEITEMQARAIFEAACEVQASGMRCEPEIMVPLVGHISELKNQKEIIVRVAAEVMKARGQKIHYSVGTMIEVPRAAIIADEIAAEAEFFSFGTNDLTQMTLGCSRDDSPKFIRLYLEQRILDHDPFATLDTKGVGALMTMAIERGRATRKKMKIGICGEHGGDPQSIHFCHAAGLDYVSCSPFRVPVARLAAAHAAMDGK